MQNVNTGINLGFTNKIKRLAATKKICDDKSFLTIK